MTSRYGISGASVRAVSGIDTNFINDTDMDQLIDSAEYEADKVLNCKFVPTTFVEFPSGDNSERIVLKFNPLLRVKALEIDDTTIGIEDIRWKKSGGVVWLQSTASKPYFVNKVGSNNLVKVKYDYGLLEDTSIQTDSSAVVLAGGPVSIPVISSTGFIKGDFVQIEGFDGFQETFVVTDISDGTHVEANSLVVGHESGSLLTKVITPPIVLRFVQIIAGMMGVARVVGQSYDEITGYTLGDMSVQKGEPYTQWREVTVQLQKEYKQIKESFRLRPAIR